MILRLILVSSALVVALGFKSVLPLGPYAPLCSLAFAGGDPAPLPAPLVHLEPKTYLFQGLTAEGVEALRRGRDQLRSRSELFGKDIRNMTTIHHAGLVARLFQGNMLLYGPPGGAKSLFVDWIVRGEMESAFQLQLHEMITEQAFTGGQNFEAAKEGRFQINTQGSLADFTVALIDEIEKGNPAALSALLRLLNERQILAGNQVIQAKLETLYATSNSNLSEFYDKFFESGQSSTAPALLNRFQFKAFVYNWLSIENQTILDLRSQRRHYLKAMARTHPDVKQDSHFAAPEKLNWPELRELAFALIQPSSLFMTVYREMIQDLRDQTHRAMSESKERHKNDQEKEPFPYIPSADYTERLRQQVPEIIVMSAFLDFLESPLSDDAQLEALTWKAAPGRPCKPILLDPMSLWRSYLVLTTVGPGHVKLKVDPLSDQKIDIDFDWSIDVNSTRDQREGLLVQNVNAEQERFRNTFLKHLAGLHEQIELRAENSVGMDLMDVSASEGEEETSFELLIEHFKRP